MAVTLESGFPVVATSGTAPTTTTPTFSTTGPSLLVALLTGAAGSNVMSDVIGVTGGGLTWTKAAGSGSLWDADCEIWYAYSPAAQTNIAVTGDWTGHDIGQPCVAVYSLLGTRTAAPFFGATTGMTITDSGAANPSVTLTMQKAGSMLLACSFNGSMYAIGIGSGANTVATQSYASPLNSAFLRSSTSTPSDGASVTISGTGWNAGLASQAGAEVLPASVGANVVQTKEAYADATATSIASGALATNPINGNFLWVVVKCQFLGSTITLSDSRGLTWTDQGGVTEVGTNQHLRHFTAPVTGSGACDVTATFGVTQVQRGIAVLEVAGVSAVQGTDEQQDAGNNPTVSGSVTVTTQPAYGLIAGNDLQGNQFTPGTGWTAAGVGPFWWPTGVPLIIEYKNITTTGAVTGNFVNPAFDRVTLVMIVFTESAESSPSTITITDPLGGGNAAWPVVLTGVASPPGSTVEIRNKNTGAVLGSVTSNGTTGAWTFTLTTP